MNKHLAIVDYGLGNIKSIINALDEIGCRSTLIKEPNQLSPFEKIILPGVGAFASAMDKLKNSGMDIALQNAKDNGALILGICLGMQLMCKSSEEGGVHKGLGWIDARVVRFPVINDLKIPHIGWNNLSIKKESPLLTGIVDNVDVYFLHSYHARCAVPDDILATSGYGEEFVAVFGRENTFGIQFHPEKSQRIGLKILNNFVQMN